MVRSSRLTGSTQIDHAVTSLVLRVHNLRNRAFFASDAVLLPLCALAAFLARFDGVLNAENLQALQAFVVWSVPLKLVALISFGVYRRLWRYASVVDLEVLVFATLTCALLDAGVGIWLVPGLGLTPGRIPYAVVLLDGAFGAVAICFPRLAIRMVARRDGGTRRRDARRAIIVGAGVAGGMIVRELAANPQLGILPVAFVDDDSNKFKLRLHNVPVLGTVRELASVARKVDATEVVIAMPSAAGRVLREVVREANAAGLSTRTVPGLYELLSGEKQVQALRQIEIHDLLRREPIQTDTAQVASLVAGKTVMVTGAGGSIGSELCRQLARLEPSQIIVVGRGENSIFRLLQEFSRSFPGVCIEPVIADVRDHARMARVIASARPYTVFHAAAHKHVPLMESNVAEAVLNNVLGTQNVVSLCAEYGVEHFVQISTDKAVSPTSVMGATKRVCEHLVHKHAMQADSAFVSVRFGNVLGSRGSVVPTFIQQIAEGGPVTVTHPEMTRYFMTIPEAVQLVLQAAALGTGGEVFVLDMGEPVRVADLARDLIRLSGLEPEVDIEIRYIGARPGEKLFEELFFNGANITKTIHPKVLRAQDAEAASHKAEDIEALIYAARENRSASAIRRLLVKIVPEYTGLVDIVESSVGVEPLLPASTRRHVVANGLASQLQRETPTSSLTVAEELV